jgi:hypothetical protein
VNATVVRQGSERGWLDISAKGVAVFGFVLTVLQVVVTVVVASVRGVDAGAKAANDALSAHARESAVAHTIMAGRVAAESSTRVIQDTLLFARVSALHAELTRANLKLDALLEAQCGGQSLCRAAAGRNRRP